MPHTLFYHPAVRDEDLHGIPQNIRSRLARAIETRLTSEPTRYGAPMKSALRPYWKLRVGDYRIVYRIVGREVRIFAILHRKEVYDAMTSRREWSPRED
ncbi:MAG: type II toxin-antitoxin system RelE/ParE family toxin [Candidatus Rokubacteria bacterium]|nr:type II toxin-antitoxin system RelE/ParE family toxin [Candidatus Rokubacteria bacterium]